VIFVLSATNPIYFMKWKIHFRFHNSKPVNLTINHIKQFTLSRCAHSMPIATVPFDLRLDLLPDILLPTPDFSNQFRQVTETGETLSHLS
jgi:hypothetical protein